jgi:hypothetical protein
LADKISFRKEKVAESLADTKLEYENLWVPYSSGQKFGFEQLLVLHS